jgi:predicted component of type VI protein secretion system
VQPSPAHFTINGETLDLDAEIISPPFLTLQVFKKKTMELHRTVSYCFEDKASLLVGRNSSCDILVENDSTVSRNHAVISYREGRFFVQDTGSKFGTLLSFKDSVRLTDTESRFQMREFLFSVVVHSDSSRRRPRKDRADKGEEAERVPEQQPQLLDI